MSNDFTKSQIKKIKKMRDDGMSYYDILTLCDFYEGTEVEDIVELVFAFQEELDVKMEEIVYSNDDQDDEDFDFDEEEEYDDDDYSDLNDDEEFNDEEEFDDEDR